MLWQLHHWNKGYSDHMADIFLAVLMFCIKENVKIFISSFGPIATAESIFPAWKQRDWLGQEQPNMKTFG